MLGSRIRFAFVVFASSMAACGGLTLDPPPNKSFTPNVNGQDAGAAGAVDAADSANDENRWSPLVTSGGDASPATLPVRLGDTPVLSDPRVASGALRLAILWDNRWNHLPEPLKFTMDSSHYGITDYGPPRASSGIMSLALPKVPPVAPGRVSGPNSIRFAHGRVVVYVDNNGNQKLDLVDRSQPRYPDEILAFSSDSLYFIDGNPSPSSSPSVLDANGRAPKTGYNARRDAAQCDPFQMAIEPSCRSFVAWQGPTVGLDLRSPGTSLVQLLMCREGILNQGSGSSAERVPTNRESMDTRWSTAGTCSADGLHLMVESAKVGDLRKVCDEVYVSTSTTHYSLATAADAPSWWPCRPTPR